MTVTNLSSQELQKLKDSGDLKVNETAYLNGDLLVAENVITKERRVISETSVLLESRRKLLRG